MSQSLSIKSNGASPDFILSVSPFAEDHRELKSILTGSNCILHSSGSCASAAVLLRRRPFSVVISEYELLKDSWRDLLAITSDSPAPPAMIVTSRLADERIWAEILNLGGYDLLSKPFDNAEVWRVIGAARRHWSNENANRNYSRGLCRASACG